ncbi:MAG: hypothetical protein U1F35_16730 [Steroidobacteraceae bacterium]
MRMAASIAGFDAEEADREPMDCLETDRVSHRVDRARYGIGTRDARGGRSTFPGTDLRPLYAQVELAHPFPDSKSFADAVPLRPAAQIMAEYHPLRPATGPALKRFVASRSSAAGITRGGRT